MGAQGSSIPVPANASPELAAFAEGLGRHLAERAKTPQYLPPFTVAGLPPAGNWLNHAVIVTNESGGRTIAASDGTDWRRVSDGAVVS